MATGRGRVYRTLIVLVAAALVAMLPVHAQPPGAARPRVVITADIERAVSAALGGGRALPPDLGGTSTTTEVIAAVLASIPS